MKKALKIIGGCVAGVVGVLLIAVAVLVWAVFTPKHLTPAVRKVADKLIICEHRIGQVELTFFSTFPQFSLQVDSVLLVNDMAGAPCDTVLRADRLRAEVNLRKLWKERAVEVESVLLEGGAVCLYTDSVGRVNYDVFVTDSLPDEPDTTAFSIPFEWMDLRRVSLRGSDVVYMDAVNDVRAYLADAEVDLTVKWQDEVMRGTMDLNVPHLDMEMGGVTYADGVAVNTHLPFEARLEDLMFSLHKATLAVNQFGMCVDGCVTLTESGEIHTDVRVAFEQWNLPDVLQLVPDSFAYLLCDLKVDSGSVNVSAEVKGVLADSVYPSVWAQVQLSDGGFAYSALPMPLHDVNVDVAVYVNLNDSTDSFADVKHLSAGMKNSVAHVSGRVERLLADVACDVAVETDVHLQDIKELLPSDLSVEMEGECSGHVKARFTLDQLTQGAYDEMTLDGDVDVMQLAVVFADWHAKVPQGKVGIHMPIEQSFVPKSFASAEVNLGMLQVTQGDSVAVDGQDIALNLSLSNPMKGDMLHVGCELTSESLSALYGTMNGDLSKAHVKATVALNQKDTTDVPLVDAFVCVNHLKGAMDTLLVDLQSPQIKVGMQSSKKNRKEPVITLDYAGKSLALSMGNAVNVATDSLLLTAFTRHRSGADNILLEWNPRVSVNLKNGLVKLADFDEDITIPTIQFDYSNRDFVIQDSRVLLGNSDFQLKGEIKDIHKFVSKNGLLTGELDFVSNTTDVNQLMSLVSGLGSTEEELVDATEGSSADAISDVESMPFIVPKGVDLTLHTYVQRALVGEQVATNLGGNLYVKDGTLILEEMGFICDAARLQLTAMYKSPRPNHLYVGLDYHMTDIQIEELVKMIPQVDSVLPMLRSFRGKGEFHLAAETNLNRHYDLKWSTLRGAASIQGKDLVLLDGETFSQIAKLMLFKKKTENKIDSISAEATVFRNEVDIFPFLVSMDKYKVALGGRHNLDMTFNYHLSLLSPLRIGVDVSGNFDDLKIKPTKCKYADDFRPAERKSVETQNMTFREMIRQALVATMKEQE